MWLYQDIYTCIPLFLIISDSSPFANSITDGEYFDLSKLSIIFSNPTDAPHKKAV